MTGQWCPRCQGRSACRRPGRQARPPRGGASGADLADSLVAQVPADLAMIPLTVPEIRRLLAALLHRPSQPGHDVRRLDWRRHHRARYSGTTNAQGSPVTLQLPWSAGEWLLPY